MRLIDRLLGRRRLVNGARERVIVATTDEGPRDAAWWADLFVLIHGLSEGDRSALGAGLRAAIGGEPALLTTASGSVADALHHRLARIGYLEREAGREDDVRRALAPHGVRLSDHRVTRLGRERLIDGLVVAHAHMRRMQGDAGAIARFCEGFLPLEDRYRALEPEAVERLRRLFATGGATPAPPGVMSEAAWERHRRAGALRREEDGSWRVTAAGRTVVPWMLDALLFERSLDAERCRTRPADPAL